MAENIELTTKVDILPVNNEAMLYEPEYDFVITTAIDDYESNVDYLKFTLIIIGRN